MTNNLGVNAYTVGGDYDDWGDKFVADMAILNKFAGAAYVIADAGGTVTLDVVMCQNFALQTTGGTAVQVDVRVPDGISRFWWAKNDRASGVTTYRCAAGGTAVTLPAGERRLIYSDGTNVVDLTMLSLAISSITGLQAALDLKAVLTGGIFTGANDFTGAVITVPTQAPGDNTTKAASTAFVTAAFTALANGVSAAYDTLSEIATAIGTKLTTANNLSELTATAVTVRANIGLILGTAAEFWANTAARVLTVVQIWNAADTVALTDAATIAVDMGTFINGSVTLGGNRTLGQPSNTKNGQSGVIRVKQDATGSRTLAYHADWEFANATAPVLSTTANAEDLLFYQVLAPNRIFASLTRAVG